MFLVKSCSKKNNVLESRTIRIGTLCEYRETESLQIVDPEEGFYTISIDFQNRAISPMLFNLMNSPSNSLISSYIANMNFYPALLGRVMVSMKARHKIINNNRFIFCISKLKDIEEATTLFPDYDSYWHLDFLQKDEFIKKMECSFLNKVVKLISDGEKIFNKEKINLKKLKVKSHFQEIIYTDRSLHIDNTNIFSMQDKLIDIFNDIKYIKPIDFKDEKEFRVVFDFYEGNKLLTPVVKKIIIPFEYLSLVQRAVI